MKPELSYDAMQSAGDAEQLFALVKNETRALGFRHVSYVMSVPSLNSGVKWLRFEDMPEGWAALYAARKYGEIDPLLKRGPNSIVPLVWSQKLFADAPRLWEDAQAFGLETGISQPCWAARGVFGILTLLRDGPPLGAGEIAQLRRRLQVVANLLHLAMYELADVPAINRVGEICLTAREREILRWTSEGKTAEIIGAILNISTRTVNFHIANVLTKLVAVNKVQAVAKARTFGLL